MPYFSFTLKQSFNNSQLHKSLKDYDLKAKIKYFSKNTRVWKILNNKKFSEYLENIQMEKRNNFDSKKKSILFFMPPSIGMGDSIEYGLAIKSIIKNNKFNKVGLAFVEKYKFIFSKHFDFDEIYTFFISEKKLKNYETVFHFTKEIKKLKNQKYERSDIEKEICNYFNTPIIRSKKSNIKKINKISLFPISTSPIRHMPVSLVNTIVDNFSTKIKIEVVLDNFYITSKYFSKNLNLDNRQLIYHENIEDLFRIINNIEYGIFVDSGPLHLAKILNKNGLLLETSVSYTKLLNDFSNISVINNSFSSAYCKAPCGLTNIFNFNNASGCYQTHKITRNNLKKIENSNALQRGQLKNDYQKFMTSPVGCVKNIDLKKILNTIENLI
tara:strand:+ start:926 stop:2077 length:1152 start_codon:yes stop_codon:yes gene_type:complete